MSADKRYYLITLATGHTQSADCSLRSNNILQCYVSSTD